MKVYKSTATNIQVDFDQVTSSGMALTGTQQCKTHGHLNSTTSCCSAGPAGMPFEVMFANGSYAIVQAALAPTSPFAIVIVTNDAELVTKVRYCAQGFPLCVLANEHGLPAAPFELDVTLS
jgi:hypothetical protein